MKARPFTYCIIGYNILYSNQFLLVSENTQQQKEQ